MERVFDLASFAQAVSSTDPIPTVLRHAPSARLRRSTSPVHNDALFGPDIQRLSHADWDNGIRSEVQSFLLPGGILVPNSMAVLSRELELQPWSVANIGDPRNLTTYDPNFGISASGALCMTEMFHACLKQDSRTAMPICGPGLWNYGHFLFDSLPAIFLLNALMPASPFYICGPQLRPFQIEILTLLGLADRYVVVDQPTSFSKLIGTTMQSLHVAYPSKFIRTAFDALSYAAPSSQGGAAKVYISRGDDTKRLMVNREEIELLVSDMGYDVIRPAEMSVIAQMERLRSACVIVGEAGAGMANIGFAEPGAKILEILPFNDAWIRNSCELLGHNWHCFLPRLQNRVTSDVAGLNQHVYHIDKAELKAAIEVIESKNATGL
jgi:hypothetical protein